MHVVSSLLPFCHDRGSEYCPCLLGESGYCQSCSLLRGEDECRCHWSGSCPWHEQAHAEPGHLRTRPGFEAVLLERKETASEVERLLLRVASRDQKWFDPSATLFIRGECDPSYAEMPLIVTGARTVTEGVELEVFVRRVGVKSARLLEADRFWLRGPYLNAWNQKPDRIDIQQRSVLLLGRGMGQAPLLRLARWAQGLGAHVELCYDHRSPVPYFIGPYLEGVTAVLGDDPQGFIHRFDATVPALVALAGSELFVQEAVDALSKIRPDARLLISNHSVFCCGEGLCGSCLQPDGSKRCKGEWSEK